MNYQLVKKMDTRNKIGKMIIGRLVSEEKRKRWKQYLKDRPRAKMIRQVSHAKKSHIEDIILTCLQHISPVAEPLALISQISFSGGTLLNRLLDGHSELHTYPCALAVDAPDEVSWPQIDIKGTPEESLSVITKTFDIAGIREGIGQAPKDSARFPFIYLPILQKQIFIEYLESVETVNMRHIFDAYMTACFGAWLNYQNHRLDKKFVMASAPGLTLQKDAINDFFEIYPDGRLVSIVRNPADWLACARTREPQVYDIVRDAVDRWKANVQAVIEINRKFKDRVCLVRFEDFINRKDLVMHHLSGFLKISFENILLTPTFNGIPLQSPNSPATDPSDMASGYRIDSRALDQNDRSLIKEMTQENYETILGEIKYS